MVPISGELKDLWYMTFCFFKPEILHFQGFDFKMMKSRVMQGVTLCDWWLTVGSESDRKPCDELVLASTIMTMYLDNAIISVS